MIRYATSAFASMLVAAFMLAGCSTTPTTAPGDRPVASNHATKAIPRAYRAENFDYFVAGDPRLPRAAHTQTGFALMGGGGNVDSAFRFIASHAGGGHIVILRAVHDNSFDPGDGNYGDLFMSRWGPVASAETIVFRSRAASFDPRVIAALRGADGIFLAGGDQANYVNYWKGTPVQEALNEHVRMHRPIGGSSAGLAVLGHYSYAALDGGSLESKEALADPASAAVTIENDFLRYPPLNDVVTDTHFSRRHRLGRLVVFVARIKNDYPAAKVFGVGVDEQSALLIGEDGTGHLAADSKGSAWLVMPKNPASTLVKGKPLSIKDVGIVQLDKNGSVDAGTHKVTHPATRSTLTIRRGKPVGKSIATAILSRDVVPDRES
jgi:cyanophycinase